MKHFLTVLLLGIFYSNNTLAGDVFINTSIEEASGIVYYESNDSLFVVDDEGLIFEITTEGEIIREKYLGNYDLEGITIGNNPNELIAAVEGQDNLLFIDSKSLTVIKEISIKRKWNGVKILKKDKKHGIEGIHNFNGKIVLVNQSYNITPEENPKDPSMLFEVRQKANGEKYYISSVTYIPYPDLAGISQCGEYLYIISDDEDLLLTYDPKTKKVVNETRIPGLEDQEGITFDKEGNLYFAIDGEGILKSNKF